MRKVLREKEECVFLLVYFKESFTSGKEKRLIGDLWRSKSTHMALMLFSGSRGISRTLAAPD